MLASAFHHRPKLHLVRQVSFRFFSHSNDSSSSSRSSSSSSPSSKEDFCEVSFTLSTLRQKGEITAQSKPVTDPLRISRKRQSAKRPVRSGNSKELIFTDGLQKLSSFPGSFDQGLHGNGFVVLPQKERSKVSADGVQLIQRRCSSNHVKKAVKKLVKNSVDDDDGSLSQNAGRRKIEEVKRCSENVVEKEGANHFFDDNDDERRKEVAELERLSENVVKKEGDTANHSINDADERRKAEKFVNVVEEIKNYVVEESEPRTKPSVRVRGRPRRRTQIDALSELQQKVEVLQSEQASASELSILMKKKAFKSASPEQLIAVLKVLKEFCPSGEKACQVLVKNSGVIWQPVDLLRRRLKVLSDFEVGEEARLRLTTSICMLSVEVEKLQETLEFLKGIGLSVESINKIICKNPKTLRLSIQSSMQPTVDFLHSTGMRNEKILKLLERRPELFAMSIDDNLMVKYKFFQQLGLSAQKFSTALRSMTQYSNDTILARLNAIKEHGFSDADVLEMVRKQPNILANSSETIKNKLNYLLHQQNRPTTEVIRFPACLGYSLEDRIIPRFKFLEENNLSKPYSLSTILATKSSDFVEKCKVLDSTKIL